MTKSDLIEALAESQSHLAIRDVELAVKGLLERMSQALSTGERIEIRGFGSFSLHFRPPRMGRNPKSGDAVALRGKYVPHFKPGKELRERVNNNKPVAVTGVEGSAPMNDDATPESSVMSQGDLDGERKTGTDA